MKKILLTALLCSTALLHGSDNITSMSNLNKAKITSTSSLSKALKRHKAQQKKSKNLENVPNFVELLALQPKPKGSQPRVAELCKSKYEPDFKKIAAERKAREQKRQEELRAANLAYKQAQAARNAAKTPVSDVPVNHTFTNDEGVLMYVVSNLNYIKVEAKHNTKGIRHFSRTLKHVKDIIEYGYFGHDQNHGGRTTPVNLYL